MKAAHEIMMTDKQIRVNKIFKIIMFSWLLLIALLILSVCLGLCVVTLALILPNISSVPIVDLISHMSLRGIMLNAIICFVGFLLVLVCCLIPMMVIVQPMFSVFSFINVTRLFVVNKPIKRKPIAIIFRVLTVLFGIALIVSPILLLVQVIPVYTFLRCVVLFFIGSIVLNIFLE